MGSNRLGPYFERCEILPTSCWQTARRFWPKDLRFIRALTRGCRPGGGRLRHHCGTIAPPKAGDKSNPDFQKHVVKRIIDKLIVFSAPWFVPRGLRAHDRLCIHASLSLSLSLYIYIYS